MSSTKRMPSVGEIWRSPAGHRFQILSVEGWRATGRDLDYAGRILNVGEDCFGVVVPMSQGWERVEPVFPCGNPDCVVCAWLESEESETKVAEG